MIYSYHIFMLPFKYSNKNNITKHFTNKINKQASYDEQAYFHKFFIDSIFNKCDTFENTTYKNIVLKTKDLYNDKEEIRRASKIYTLDIDKLQLKVFDEFNIAILSFHIENKKYSQTQEILEINDYLRRIYPEYLDDNNNCNLVAQSIKLDTIEETFNTKNKNNSPKISNIITALLGEVTPAVDDRMFTISYFNNQDFANETKQNYLVNDKWYEYVFIDGDGKMVQDSLMQRKLIKKATYTRWRDYGTLYGISKYSFVCLANSDFPFPHMKTLYFDMFTLLLMVRATLLKFSDEVSEIAKNLNNKNTIDNVAKLYERYIQFVNGYYFREITAKDQGLELYEMALETLNIQRDIKDLDSEIEELFRYVEMKQRKEAEIEAEKTNKKLNDINLYGGILLFASFLTGFFGMNVGDNDNFPGWIVYPIIGISTYWAYKKFKGDS